MAELGVLLSFPPDDVKAISTPAKYEDAMNSYIKKLDKISKATWTKTIDKKNLLEMLNPEVNSIPYLISLNQQIAALWNDLPRLAPILDIAVVFVATFDPVQVRYVGEEWRTFVEALLEALPAIGGGNLSPIAFAMLRLDPTCGTFTTTHLRLVRKCLQIGRPSDALPVIDKDIYALPTSPIKGLPEDLLSEDHELSNAFITPNSGFTHKLSPDYLLEYYLLGAHIYIGTHNYARARLFLEYVILTPAIQHAVSALQIEAYRKWLLIGLLATGQTYPLPRTHDAGAMRSIRALAKPYDVLAEAFEKRDLRKYHAEMDQGMAMWHEDGNLRLVREVGEALMRYRVVDLRKIYAALPMSRVASLVGTQEQQALALVTDMIRAKHLSASITPSSTTGAAGDAVLRFHDTTTSSSTQDQDLETQTHRIEALVTYVRDADRRLQLTKEYVEFVKRSRRSGGEMDLADQMDLSWDNGGMGVQPLVGMGVLGAGDEGDDGDEDLMGG